MWILAWRRTPTSPSLSTSRPGSRVAGRDTCDLWRLMCCLPRTRNLAQACPSVSAETSSTTPPFNRMRPLGGWRSWVLRPPSISVLWRLVVLLVCVREHTAHASGGGFGVGEPGPSGGTVHPGPVQGNPSATSRHATQRSGTCW